MTVELAWLSLQDDELEKLSRKFWTLEVASSSNALGMGAMSQADN
jgi:hypothetical protein